MVTVQLLKRFGLFKGLTDSELDGIAKLCHVHSLHANDRILEEGTRATDLHLCCSGKVDIVVWVQKPLNKHIPVDQAQAGEVFGWSALVAPYTYSASVVCTENGEEIRIRSSDLLDLFHQYPHVGYTVMANLSAEISARLVHTRSNLITEWLSTAVPTSSSTWGEPGRR